MYKYSTIYDGVSVFVAFLALQYRQRPVLFVCGTLLFDGSSATHVMAPFSIS